MGKQKISTSRLLSHTLSANLEHLQNFPEKIEGGVDVFLGKVYSARFLRGYVGDSQELWRQARQVWGANGIEPVANYEVGSLGFGDQLTHKVWAELHKPNSRQLSIRLLSHKAVEESWKQGDKTDSPKEFESLNEFKTAVACLEGEFHRVMPWNLSFKALNFFLILINFGESELAGWPGRLLFLGNFVDEVLRTNARNWEEKKPFLSYQDLSVKWSADLTRKLGGYPNKLRYRGEKVWEKQIRPKGKTIPEDPTLGLPPVQ
jgi:hypothetical protein